MYGVALSYGVQNRSDVRIGGYLSAVAKNGGQDVNVKSIQTLLADALLSQEASIVCSGAAIATGKLFYYVRASRLMSYLNATQAFDDYQDGIQHLLENEIIETRSSIVCSCSALTTQKLYYYVSS